MFAIDPCNAQYSFTTSRERNCGVFPWESYLGRLSVTDIGEVHGLCYHKPILSIHQVGSLEEGQADIFADADIRHVAESLPSTACKSKMLAARLQSDHGLSLESLMSRSSNNGEYAANVKLFKDLLGPVICDLRVIGLRGGIIKWFYAKEHGILWLP
jgi:hypothetical protein